jgi:hypothetical protein
MGHAGLGDVLEICITFDGRRFATLESFHAEFSTQARVPLSVFVERMKKRIGAGEAVTETLLRECLTLDVEAYRAQRMRRKTSLKTIEGCLPDLQAWFEARPDSAMGYPMFRQRVLGLRKKRRSINEDMLEKARTISVVEWRKVEGGGRRTETEFRGVVYPTLRACLEALDRAEDYQMIKSRMAKGWDIESALEPPREAGGGIIYRIHQISSGKLYFGLTSMPLAERWRIHRSASEEPAYQLHVAMNRAGVDDFEIEQVDSADSDQALADLEKQWILKHDSIWPNGLNGNAGGAIGGGRPKPCSWNKRSFGSVDERNRVLGEEHSLEPYVVGSRIRDGIPLEAPQRRVTKKRLDDPDQQRQWLKLVRLANRGEIELDQSWNDPEVWRKDVDPEGHTGLHLVRDDPGKPWGPGNFVWVTVQEKMEGQSGKALTIGKVTWPTIKAAAEAYGLKTSTLKYRLSKGMSPEEAIATTTGPTSAKEIEFEGDKFASLHKAATTLSARHGISRDKARDRIRRGVPTSRWASM